jgi:aldehyde dehydrogenase (NAD+)
MISSILSSFGFNPQQPLPGAYADRFIATGGKFFSSYSPIDGSELGKVYTASVDADYEEVIKISSATFNQWRLVPAPVRGLLVRDIAQSLREHQQNLAKIISWENGKILRRLTEK